MADEGNSNSPFPSADVDEELNPGKNKGVQVDPVSSQVAKDKAVAVEKKKKKKKSCEKEDAIQTLKTTIIVSGVILALAGAVFAITKKMRQK